MELCEGGELADALKSQERIPEEECKIIMTRLASAISYLHKNGECCTRTMWLCVKVVWDTLQYFQGWQDSKKRLQPRF